MAKGKECKPWRLSVMNQNYSAWFIKLSSTPTFLPPNKNKSTALTKYPHLYPNPRIVEAESLKQRMQRDQPSNVVVTLHFLRCPFEHALACNAKNAQLSFISRIANNGSYSRIGASGWMEKRGWQRSKKKGGKALVKCKVEFNDGGVLIHMKTFINMFKLQWLWSGNDCPGLPPPLK